jgi:hypothetical protein
LLSPGLFFCLLMVRVKRTTCPIRGEAHSKAINAVSQEVMEALSSQDARF